MFGGTAWRGRITTLVVLAGICFFAPSVTRAATLFVSPSAGQFAVGETFNVVIRVNSQGAAVNASEGVLSFNPAQLQVQSITLSGSIFNLNVQEPEFSNTAGTVRWTGVILNPGYTGTSGTLITVRFKALVAGTTSVKFSSGAVLANDGAGTNLLSGMSGGTYTIGPIASPTTPTPTPTSAIVAPVVISPTHSNTIAWYNNNDPLFTWDLPAGVDGVSYLINEKPTANPGNASDGVVSRISFSDIPDGSTYFHIKFRSGGVWGPITHYPFNIDTVPPAAFSIIREDATDTKNPRPLLSFSTTDSGSGVARYMMRIGEGDWFEVPESDPDRPFALPLQAPGSRTVFVEAIDHAGNSTRASLILTIEPITRPVIVQYPDAVDRGEAFTVSGTADPQVVVAVDAVRVSGAWGRLFYTDHPAASVRVQSDGTGRWNASFGVLEPGEYRLTAVAINNRGASSERSEAVFVRVGYGLLGRLATLVRSLFAGAPWLFWILRVAFLFLLISLCSAVLHCGDWKFWRLAATLPAVERKESSKLEELLKDMDDELALLEKVARNRPLYPEEKYLKAKLAQYRKSLRILIRDPRSRLAKRG